MRILFADDTQDTLNLYGLAMRLNGIDAELACDGEEAVRCVEQSPAPFDAIVLDVEMPHMNGWDALSAIRRLPQGQTCYIIMFTAYGDTRENRARALERGADFVLQKPVLPQLLTDLIRQGVAQKQLMAQPHDCSTPPSDNSESHKTTS